jgi:hypothetical protein
MEERFGHDFSRVRIHDDARAAASAHAVGALAYTVGGDIVFGIGRYAPDTPDGRSLLTHELAHVIQQSRTTGIGSEQRLSVGPVDDPLEREAARAADRALAGAGTIVSPGATAGALQRQAAPPELAPNPYTGPMAGSAPPAPAGARPPATQRPGPRGYSLIGTMGRFDADLLPPDRPASGSAPATPCQLRAVIRARFRPRNDHGTWPPGRFDRWVRDFCALVSRRWSYRYLLAPARSCPGEVCTSAAVALRVEPVTANEHHVVDVSYRNPHEQRSHAGTPDVTPGEFFEEDIRSRGTGIAREHTTAVHEVGHWLGVKHIRCDSNAWHCYGITAGQSDDVMGRGEFISARDYRPFTDAMRHITGCPWRTAGEHGGSRAGSMALAFGVLGALLGLGLGIAAGFGLGGILALGGALGVLGAFEGFVLGDI